MKLVPRHEHLCHCRKCPWQGRKTELNNYACPSCKSTSIDIPKNTSNAELDECFDVEDVEWLIEVTLLKGFLFIMGSKEYTPHIKSNIIFRNGDTERRFRAENKEYIIC
jgi:hypothetical protein